MSPLEIRIMLHYFYSPEDWSGQEDEQFVSTILNRFVRMGLLEQAADGYECAQYKITEKGTAYVEMLKDVPIPVVAYVDPRNIE